MIIVLEQDLALVVPVAASAFQPDIFDEMGQNWAGSALAGDVARCIANPSLY